MSDGLLNTLRQLSDLSRIPRLGERVRFSNEALHLMINGQKVEVDSLKVRLEDIHEDCVVLAFAFCDSSDNPIVNIGRYELRGVGSTFTISKVANSLNFTVS